MATKYCTVKNCLRPTRCKGLCGLHYQRWRIHGDPLRYTPRSQRIKHGHAREGKISSEYYSWAAIINRITNPNNHAYRHYGGRGIKIDPRWLNFKNFLADVGPKPSPKHSIVRYPDRNGNYEPGNVRWATSLQQCNNTARNIRWTFNNKEQTVAEWAREIGLKYQTLADRVRRYGWTVEEALTIKLLTPSERPLGKKR